MKEALRQTVAAKLGLQITSAKPLGGGCVGDVFLIETTEGRKLVAKCGDAGSGLDIEGRMLQYLKKNNALTVPDVFISMPDLLVMSAQNNDGRLDATAQQNAAIAIAALHQQQGPAFGFEEDTLIGGLHQPNPRTDRWVDFYRDHRLIYMADEAEKAGCLPASLRHRLDVFLFKLPELIGEPHHPQLLHGDLWGGNILVGRGHNVSFIDPAIYYGHGEMDLAFSTLFNTFNDAFFQQYQQINSIEPGFWEERRDIYNLWPLLVHIRLFGGPYVSSLSHTLDKFGG